MKSLNSISDNQIVDVGVHDKVVLFTEHKDGFLV